MHSHLNFKVVVVRPGFLKKIMCSMQPDLSHSGIHAVWKLLTDEQNDSEVGTLWPISELFKLCVALFITVIVASSVDPLVGHVSKYACGEFEDN